MGQHFSEALPVAVGVGGVQPASCAIPSEFLSPLSRSPVEPFTGHVSVPMPQHSLARATPAGRIGGSFGGDPGAGFAAGLPQGFGLGSELWPCGFRGADPGSFAAPLP